MGNLKQVVNVVLPFTYTPLFVFWNYIGIIPPTLTMYDCSVVGFCLSLNKGKKNEIIPILIEGVLLSNNNEGILLKL